MLCSRSLPQARLSNQLIPTPNLVRAPASQQVSKKQQRINERRLCIFIPMNRSMNISSLQCISKYPPTVYLITASSIDTKRPRWEIRRCSIMELCLTPWLRTSCRSYGVHHFHPIPSTSTSHPSLICIPSIQHPFILHTQTLTTTENIANSFPPAAPSPRVRPSSSPTLNLSTQRLQHLPPPSNLISKLPPMYAQLRTRRPNCQSQARPLPTRNDACSYRCSRCRVTRYATTTMSDHPLPLLRMIGQDTTG